MPKDPLQPTRCSELLSALATIERLLIVRLLHERGPMHATDILESTGVDPANVSHHLTVLTRCKMLRRARRGRYVYYRIAPNFFDTSAQDGFLDLGCCRLKYADTREKRTGPKRPKKVT